MHDLTKGTYFFDCFYQTTSKLSNRYSTLNKRNVVTYFKLPIPTLLCPYLTTFSIETGWFPYN